MHETDTLKPEDVYKQSDRQVPDEEPVIRIRNVSKTYKVHEKNMDTMKARLLSVIMPNTAREIKALDGINLDIYKGEFFGILGHNGSGKSTLLKIILGAYPPDKGGEVQVQGKIIRLALGMGFDSNLSARDNIYLNASLLGIPFKRIGHKFDAIIKFAELEDFTETKVKFFSSGMRSRLAFSIAVHAEADIFLMDEFFGGVGDIRFKEKSEEVFRDSLITGRTIIHVSHNLSTIKEHCQRVLILNHGKAVAIGPPEEVIPVYEKLLKKA